MWADCHSQQPSSMDIGRSATGCRIIGDAYHAMMRGLPRLYSNVRQERSREPHSRSYRNPPERITAFVFTWRDSGMNGTACKLRYNRTNSLLSHTLLPRPSTVEWPDFHWRLSACFFPHDISKINAARITKLGTEMFHDESWKSIYLWVKSSRLWVTKTLSACVFALLWVLASPSSIYCRRSDDIIRRLLFSGR